MRDKILRRAIFAQRTYLPRERICVVPARSPFHPVQDLCLRSDKAGSALCALKGQSQNGCQGNEREHFQDYSPDKHSPDVSAAFSNPDFCQAASVSPTSPIASQAQGHRTSKDHGPQNTGMTQRKNSPFAHLRHSVFCGQFWIQSWWAALGPSRQVLHSQRVMYPQSDFHPSPLSTLHSQLLRNGFITHRNGFCNGQKRKNPQCLRGL